MEPLNSKAAQRRMEMAVVIVVLGIMALAHVVIVTLLLVIFLKVRKPAKTLFFEAQKISLGTVKLLDNLNELVESDLHGISDEANNLISKISDFVSDLNAKSRSVNFLFKPLSFLSSWMNFSKDQTEEKKATIPELMKWVFSGILLIKSTKELLRKHGK
jgi:uncharacterized protein YoxC